MIEGNKPAPLQASPARDGADTAAGGIFREMIEHLGDMVALLDRQGVFTYVSLSMLREMGYAPRAVMGQPIFSMIHADDLSAVHEGFQDLVKTKAGAGEDICKSFHFRLRHHDGSWRYIEGRAVNLLDNPDVASILINARDVSGQKRTERELERYRQHLEEMIAQRTRELQAANRRVDAFLSASPDSLIAIDRDGFISYASGHFKQRYPLDAAIFSPGMHILDAFEVIARNIPITPDDPRYQDLRRWWSQPEGTREFRHAGGMWTRLQAKRMKDTGETVISSTDITDYKRQQALLAAQSAELQAALMSERETVEQQKTFISMVSHEFRTPLSIIDGSAQILHSRGTQMPPDMMVKRTGAIRAAVERLIQLIETILSSHMIETGKIGMQQGPCNLPQIIKDVCRDQQGLSPKHNIMITIEPGVPSSQMLDEKLIRQVFTNLLSNAVKYAPNSPDVHVNVSLESEGGTEKVRVDVRDRGVGIPEAEQAKIFSKYFRASTSGGIPGSGLGLTLVKQFVEMHGGTIGLRSEVDEGTTMTVRLPLVPSIVLE